MTTPPEDVDALFDLPPLQEPSQPAESSTAAEEAALAAELASAIASGDFAADAPDSRTDQRVKVWWPARLRLPDGRVIELKVRDVSRSGVGLVSDEDIPAGTVADFEMDVPQPNEGNRITPVKGTIRMTSYTVVQGLEILCGGSWQAPPAGLELVTLWIKKLRD